MRHIPPAKRERLLRMVALWNDTTMTMTEIGRDVGLPRGSVARILFEARRNGMAVRLRGQPKPLTGEQIAWAVAARRDGRTLDEVAAALDRSVARICRVVMAAEQASTREQTRRAKLARQTPAIARAV
jgi:hypothetical protein